MPKTSRPRKGSLQFWPRKRAAKFLPSVNWGPINKLKEKKQGLLGFITYKVGMASALVADKTEHSLTKEKQTVIPVTILEAPNMKILSVKFYKSGKPIKEFIVSKDKELKKKLKIPKSIKTLEPPKDEDYDDIRVLVYSLPKQTRIKKTPDLIELAVESDNKFSFVKNLIDKEISLKDFLNYNLMDVRGLTKGKGTQGPVKRFGISLKVHKSEKGRRTPGSLGPWHPARVTYQAPMAGQLGLFSRIHYNLNVISSGNISEKDINPKSGFKHYGKIKTNYVILKGSVQGPSKRQILITPSFRPTKSQEKKQYEFIELK